MKLIINNTANMVTLHFCKIIKASTRDPILDMVAIGGDITDEEIEIEYRNNDDFHDGGSDAGYIYMQDSLANLKKRNNDMTLLILFSYKGSDKVIAVTVFLKQFGYYVDSPLSIDDVCSYLIVTPGCEAGTIMFPEYIPDFCIAKPIRIQ